MRNKINLVTGETYSLSELLSGERRIIIPDLQRDYCWGATSGGTDRVTGFVKGLIEQSKEHYSKKLNIGVVYGYESPTNHVQLCDGQQRITTLYLLIGMINRYLGDNVYAQFLTPVAHDRKALREPYLQYAIRESSLYFLRDLLNDVFLAVDPPLNSAIDKIIRESDWYFRDYDYDPSVQSMIGALVSIESVLRTLRERVSDIDSFGRFLLNDITFMYYDLENRSNGEETFVVINTAGEPLAPTENLKPLVIESPINANYSRNLADEWEEIETWFWKMRANGNDTADAGFNEFLRWVAILHYAGVFSGLEKASKEEVQRLLVIEDEQRYSFPVHIIPFGDVLKCWEKVKFLFETWEYKKELDSNWLSPQAGHINQIDCLKLLPLVAWLLKYNPIDANGETKALLRIHRFFCNIARLDNVAKSVNEVLSDALSLAVKFDDIAKAYADISTSATLLTEEEKRKLRIFFEAGERREEIERAFWRVEDDTIFWGEITPLLDWSTTGDVFDFDKFKKYTYEFCHFFHPKEESSLDLVRRALLSYNLTKYPVKNGKNLSFCDEPQQWKQVIFDNSELIRTFLDELAHGTEFQSIIERCDPANKWFEISHNEIALKYCEKKNIQDDSIQGILLIKRKNATTYFKVNLLKETRERFGADEIDYIYNDCIGFHKTISGRKVIFQRWLNPEPDKQVDLYLMSDPMDRNSYIDGSNPEGETDLEKLICAKITGDMTAEDITRIMKTLVEQWGGV